MFRVIAAAYPAHMWRGTCVSRRWRPGPPEAESVRPDRDDRVGLPDWWLSCGDRRRGQRDKQRHEPEDGDRGSDSPASRWTQLGGR
jgi:hypothetical protein